MPIPREILDVERPVNTVVIAYGRDKHLYAVRQRVGCKNRQRDKKNHHLLGLCLICGYSPTG